MTANIPLGLHEKVRNGLHFKVIRKLIFNHPSWSGLYFDVKSALLMSFNMHETPAEGFNLAKSHF